LLLHPGHGDLWHPSLWDSFDVSENEKRIVEFDAGTAGFGLSGCMYLAALKMKGATDSPGKSYRDLLMGPGSHMHTSTTSPRSKYSMVEVPPASRD
jgi:hypothetical protein